jgi:hypothetical protein
MLESSKLQAITKAKDMKLSKQVVFMCSNKLVINYDFIKFDKAKIAG